MKKLFQRALLAGAFACMAAPAFAADDCSSVTGDVILSARTPQVDLYDGPTGKRIKSVDDDKFPKCVAVTARAPNMMLQVSVDGQAVWVPPHMVNYRLAGKKPKVIIVACMRKLLVILNAMIRDDNDWRALAT